MRRLDPGSGRVRLRVNEHTTSLHANIKRRDLFGKRRRRSSRIGQVLIAMPWTGNAAINDAALTERSILVPADIRNGNDDYSDMWLSFCSARADKRSHDT